MMGMLGRLGMLGGYDRSGELGILSGYNGLGELRIQHVLISFDFF